MIHAMGTLRRLASAVIVALVASSPLLAHHDWPVDRTRQITLKGTVTAFLWADPHVTIALDVPANGTVEKWKLGGSSKKNSAVNGWDKNTLKPGDVITAIGFRFRDGSNAAQLQKIVMANGREMDLYKGLRVLTSEEAQPDARLVPKRLNAYCNDSGCPDYSKSAEAAKRFSSGGRCFMAVVGTCGKYRFVRVGNGFVSSTEYFDGSGKLAAAKATSDAPPYLTVYGLRPACSEVIATYYCAR
jgi:hypothetical protein